MDKNKNSILIIDDEAMNIKALMSILSQDYTLFAHKNPQDSLAVTKQLNPDLILLDVMMPGRDGFEVIHELKEDTDTADIPVIFITGMNAPESEVKGFSLGAVDYIHKPFLAPIVQARIQSQIKIINLLRKVQDMSVTDYLTGIGNRRYFNVKLNEEWDRAKRLQIPLGFILLDIDNFKVFNDTHGHLCGDMALQSVARMMKAAITRATDKVARWGGEEFAVILPNTDNEGTLLIAEKIRESIEKNMILYEGEIELRFTVSMGAHSLIPQRDDIYNLTLFVSDTDDALYRAKIKGKNQVCFVGDY